jgi:hypothetical protein
MKVQSIVMVIVILLLLYVVMKYVLNDANTMTGLMSGTDVQTIVAKDLAKDDSGLHSSNFAYSIWFYIDDWNYNYDKNKVLFVRSPLGTIPTDTTIENIYPCPGITFTPNTNDLMVFLETTSTIHLGSCSVGTSACPDGYCVPNVNGEDGDCSLHQGNPSTVESATIHNVPIQKWTNVTISVYGRSLDIYLDGKLVQTTPLSGTAQVNPDASVYITPNGGFSGWTSKFAYYPNALNPQEVWDIYAAGYGASWLSNLFGKYSVKIAFLENGAEDSSFTF